MVSKDWLTRDPPSELRKSIIIVPYYSLLINASIGWRGRLASVVCYLLIRHTEEEACPVVCSALDHHNMVAVVDLVAWVFDADP